MGTTSVGYSIVIDFRSWLSANWQGCMRSSSQLSRVEGKDGFGFLSKSNNSGKTIGTISIFFWGVLNKSKGPASSLVLPLSQLDVTFGIFLSVHVFG